MIHSNSEQVEKLYLHLPLKLRKDFNPNAFQKALEENYLEINDNCTIHWLLESKTLLAYFCGCMWSGDYTYYERKSHKQLWGKGPHYFPEKKIDVLFQTKNLRDLRKNRLWRELPENHEFIDQLFEQKKEFRDIKRI